MPNAVEYDGYKHIQPSLREGPYLYICNVCAIRGRGNYVSANPRLSYRRSYECEETPAQCYMDCVAEIETKRRWKMRMAVRMMCHAVKR